MKKALVLILSFTVIFALAACTFHLPGSTEQETTESFSSIEYTVGTSGNFIYHEYPDHVEIFSYSGNSENLLLPAEIDKLPVTTFGSAFKRSLTLVTLTIPDSYKVIEPEAFAECYKLKEVFIEEKGVEKIESRAFYGCQKLQALHIPSTVKSISEDAFKYCTDVVIYGNPGSAAENIANMFSSLSFRNEKDYKASLTTTQPTEEEKENTTPSAPTTAVRTTVPTTRLPYNPATRPNTTAPVYTPTTVPSTAPRTTRPRVTFPPVTTTQPTTAAPHTTEHSETTTDSGPTVYYGR